LLRASFGKKKQRRALKELNFIEEVVPFLDIIQIAEIIVPLEEIEDL